MKIVRVIICLALLVGVVTLAPEVYTLSPDQKIDFNSKTDTSPEEVYIEQGISINGIDMSGKTKTQAEDLLEAYYENMADGKLEIQVGSSYYSKSYREIGFDWDYKDPLDSALSLGQSVGTVKKYKALSDMHAGVMALEGSDHMDQISLLTFVRSIGERCYSDPIDSTLTRENGTFFVTPGRKGFRVDETATYEEITKALEGFPAHAKVKAVTQVVEQNVSYEMLSKVKDLLGTCTTEVSGTDDRAWNVSLGSSNINGTLLMPGESASASMLMKERTQQNGYKMAGQYVDGQSVDTWGGGICQVSSTLYNALLKSEIQIDERHNHSMTVRYLDYSMDAAISWGTKDMRFTNNLEYPIYIEGWSKNRRCTFNIYGCETRPANRSVKYVSVVDAERYEPDNIIYSNEYPVGYEKKSGQAHPYVRSHMDKIVYVDGEQVSRETIHYDTYQPSIRTIVRGTYVAPQPTVPETTPAAGG